ncbi:MAG: hypothetical protein LBS21_16295 [Clostridiales bacterium]|jgi:hypothetical protein|nr:hypothetical protein [Clostridiales bacterium]
MGDVFKEQLVKKTPSTKDVALRVLIGAATGVLVILSFALVPAFAPILAAALVFLAFYLGGMLNIEYEYIFTNGELDIDCIYNKSRRKRMFSANVRDFEVMAHVEDKTHIRDFDSAEVVKDFSSGKITDYTYAFLFSYKGKRTKFIISPNETILKAFAATLSKRKLFLKSNIIGGSYSPAATPQTVMSIPPIPVAESDGAKNENTEADTQPVREDE